MRRFVIPVETRLVYVESRGWLLGKLGIGVLLIAGAVVVWGPLVAGRTASHASRRLARLGGRRARGARGRCSSLGGHLGLRMHGLRAHPFARDGYSGDGLGDPARGSLPR